MANLIGLWLLLQGVCVAAGWILSLFGQVNATGYLIFFVLTGTALALWRKHWWPVFGLHRWPIQRTAWKRYTRRFRRIFPLLFLCVAAGALLGGSLYHPNNYDALSYRLPRILMWWAHSSWYWIDTPNPRMNFSGVNFEWLMMPMLVLTHSDHFFFLINLAGFLLMPGLLFSVLVEVGVAPRVAWAWMWLLPLGFCYLTEAASIGNDTIAASYVLASIYFAFRARKRGRVEDLALAFLAASLATGIKASNIPLTLPMFFAMWPALRLLRTRPIFSAGMILFCLAVSFVPLAALNQTHTGQWAGDPGDVQKQQVGNPVAGVIGNSLLLMAQVISPHIFPYARNVSIWVVNHFPVPLREMLARDFPRFSWQVGELPQEELGGLGLGVTVLLGAAFFSNGIFRASWDAIRRSRGFLIVIMAWVALFAYMGKLGNEAASRLLSPYYPLLMLPILLFPGQARLVRQHWWKTVGVLSGLGALVALLLTPSRPLWPGERVFNWLAATCPQNTELARAKRVYSVYADRSTLLTPLARHIPDTVPVFGLIGGPNDAAASLWQPYGKRQVLYFTKLDRSRHPDVEWVVIEKPPFEASVGEPLDRWIQKTGGTVVDQELITNFVSVEPSEWYVVRFR